MNLGGGDVDTSTPVGSMLLTIMAALAQMEHDIKRERIVDSISKRREAGKISAGARAESPTARSETPSVSLRVVNQQLKSPATSACREPRSTGDLARSPTRAATRSDHRTPPQSDELHPPVQCGGQVPCRVNNFVNTVRACPRTGDLRFPFFPSIERSSSSCAGTRSGSTGSMRWDAMRSRLA